MDLQDEVKRRERVARYVEILQQAVVREGFKVLTPVTLAMICETYLRKYGDDEQLRQSERQKIARIEELEGIIRDLRQKTQTVKGHLTVVK